MNRQWIMGAWGCASLALLAGCSGGSTSESSTLTVAGDVPIAYAQRVNAIAANPTDRRRLDARRRPHDSREVLVERRRSTT